MEMAASATRDPEFQVILKKLQAINGRLNELSAISGQAADKIVGSEPVPFGGDTAKELVSSSYLTDLSRTLEHAESTVERIYRNVTRITNEF
jgi:hypothetical protein